MIIKWIGRLFGPNERKSTTVGGAIPARRNGRVEGETSLASVVDPPHMLRTELERARRYEHDLSIVALSTTVLEDPQEARAGERGAAAPIVESGPPQVVSLVAAAALREVLRESDILCFQATENRFVLALAESDGEEARGALARIRQILGDRLRLGIRAGVARFPEDALTLDDLIEEAATRAIRPVAVAGSSGDPDPTGNGDGRHNGAGLDIHGSPPNLRLVRASTEPSDA